MDATNDAIERLIQAALAARENAYAPYSQFAVGAAVLAVDGHIEAGCNIENGSYGLTICAERVAISTAVANGRRAFEAIAIASVGAVTPCGACLQVLAEFCEQATVLLCDVNGNIAHTRTLNDLLPERFIR